VTAPLYAVLPGGIDDPAAPSGGNTYDRRVLTGLAETRKVHEIVAPASWPHPDAFARAALGDVLAGLPDGATVLLDGLVACAVPEICAAQAERLRLVVLVHLPLGDETGLTPAQAGELTEREGRTLRAAAAVVATSESAARRLETLHDLPANSVRVAPPGVDGAPLAAPSPDGGRLLCVAAVTPRKAQDVLVQGLRTITDLTWTCTLVGALDRAPAFTDRVRKLAADIPGGDRVTFAGTRSGDLLAQTYAAADLLILPSLAETYGMVITEALARGVPVLATRVDGVPEALGAATGGALPGALVPPGDPHALATALRRWLTEPQLRRSWRDAARDRRAGLQGWDETTRRLSEVLDT
jgi:glycosyltransferase involved in cell wall biosynthesis